MSQRKAHNISDRERTKDIHIDENVDFESMYLSENVLLGLKASGFERPSPIQLAAIPLGRCGLDMVVQAKSGTGKTCVFTVVALEMVSVSAFTTQVLVITPTREIAVQVTQVINAIGSKIPGLRASTFIGGMHLSLDKAKLQCCHVAVGTLGRITQLIEMRLLRLDNIRLLVLDEADQLLTGQFADGVVHIASALPLNKQVIALSATYTEDVAKVAEGLMRSPNHVRLGKDSPALLGVDQFVKLLPFHSQPHRIQKNKYMDLLSILSKVTFNQCLVFSNSQLRAESVCNKLRASGWPVSFLTGGQAQKDRLIALDALCSYKCRVLVSTDLSARGLDSEHVNLVINLDMPRDHATYLHRVGRAGRFGSRGSAITLATEGDEWLAMRAIALMANVHIRVLKDDWVPDIASDNVEDMEYVQFMSEEEYAQYVLISSATNYDTKNAKSKSKKELDQKSKTSKTISENLTGNCKRNEQVSSDTSSDSSAEYEINPKDKSVRKRKQELNKQLQERIGKVKAENSSALLSVLRRLNLEQSSNFVCFDNIMTEVSEKYGHVSANDNPVVHIPPLPDMLEISVAELQSLTGHWKSVEQDLQEVILSIDESWKNLSFTVENALRGRMEGEETVAFLENTEKTREREEEPLAVSNLVDGAIQVNGNGTPLAPVSSNSSGIKYKFKDSEANSSTRMSDEEEKEVPKNIYRMSSNYGRQRSYYEQNTDDTSTEKSMKLKKGKHTRNGKNYKDENIYESHQYYWKMPNETEAIMKVYTNIGEVNGFGQYETYKRRQSKKYDGCNRIRRDLNDEHENDKLNTYPNYEDVSIACHKYQNYIDSAEKFAMIMDYVQSMGRQSYYFARDYHLGIFEEQ